MVAKILAFPLHISNCQCDTSERRSCDLNMKGHNSLSDNLTKDFELASRSSLHQQLIPVSMSSISQVLSEPQRVKVKSFSRERRGKLPIDNENRALTAEICEILNFEPLYLRTELKTSPRNLVSWFSTSLYHHILEFVRNRRNRFGWALMRFFRIIKNNNIRMQYSPPASGVKRTALQ